MSARSRPRSSRPRPTADASAQRALSFGPNAKTAVATRTRYGTTRSNTAVGVPSSSNAPSPPPMGPDDRWLTRHGIVLSWPRSSNDGGPWMVDVRTVGILSPGDMGAAIGSVLRQSGLDVITCLKDRSQLTRLRAAEAGIQ